MYRDVRLAAEHEVAVLTIGEVRVAEIGAAEDQLIVKDVDLHVLHPHHLVPPDRQLALEHAAATQD